MTFNLLRRVVFATMLLAMTVPAMADNNLTLRYEGRDQSRRQTLLRAGFLFLFVGKH